MSREQIARKAWSPQQDRDSRIEDSGIELAEEREGVEGHPQERLAGSKTPDPRVLETMALSSFAVKAVQRSGATGRGSTWRFSGWIHGACWLPVGTAGREGERHTGARPQSLVFHLPLVPAGPSATASRKPSLSAGVGASHLSSLPRGTYNRLH